MADQNISNLLNAAAVRKVFGVTDMTLWRWLQDEDLKFPQPIFIGRRRYWREGDIADFQARMAAAGRAA